MWEPCRGSGEMNMTGYIIESNGYGAADRQGVRALKSKAHAGVTI